MNRDRHHALQDVLVFALLTAIGVTGRWAQPVWCFTPTAAAAIFAGWYFSRVAIAVLVPLAILTISDLVLPAYNSIPVMLVTYVAMVAPVWLGRLQRGESSRWRAAMRWAVIGFIPATLFYLASNFAVWAFHSNYEWSLAGLAQCYWAAVPFYRWMLAGDLFYLAVLVTCMALAGVTKPLSVASKSSAPF